MFECCDNSANHSHDEESNVEQKWLLEYSKLWDGPGPPKPLSLALSEFHFVVLMNNMLKVCPWSLRLFPQLFIMEAYEVFIPAD